MLVAQRIGDSGRRFYDRLRGVFRLLRRFGLPGRCQWLNFIFWFDFLSRLLYNSVSPLFSLLHRFRLSVKFCRLKFINRLNFSGGQFICCLSLIFRF